MRIVEEQKEIRPVATQYSRGSLKSDITEESHSEEADEESINPEEENVLIQTHVKVEVKGSETLTEHSQVS